MVISAETHDRLHAALDPLVQARTLSPDQANEVYRAVATSGAVTTTAPSRQTESWSRGAFGAGIGVLGSGLLASAFLISYALAQDDLGWKLAVGMVGPVAVLAIVVLAAAFARSGSDYLLTVAATAGSVVAVSLALGLLTTGNAEALPYLSGLVMLLIGLAGYATWRRQLFIVTAVLGGLVLVGQAAAHLLDSSLGQDENNVLFLGVILMVYGVVVVLAGWRLSCRHLAGVLGGVIALNSLSFVIVTNGFTGALLVETEGSIRTSYRSDTVIALIAGLLVCLALAAAYAMTREAGFMVVAGLGAAGLPAVAVPFLTQKHPLEVAALVAGLGAAACLAGMWLAWRTPHETDKQLTAATRSNSR